MTFRRLLLTVAMGLSACAGSPAQIASKAAPQSLQLAPERYIVAGIDNVRTAPAPRAGSSPRGYDGISGYGPSTRARQVMRSLETDYGLRGSRSIFASSALRSTSAGTSNTAQCMCSGSMGQAVTSRNP